MVQAEMLLADAQTTFATQPLLKRRLVLQPSALHAAFAVAWEAQSQVATLTYVGLTAFGSMWLALPVMLVWSLVATGVYAFSRRRGAPDLLEVEVRAAHQERGFHVRTIAASFIKVWMAGLQAFAFTRISGHRLEPHSRRCLKSRAVYVALLFAGLTLFGVATTEHLLRRAGYRGSQLVRLSLVGPFLNVPYRVLLSAAFAHFVWSIVHMLSAPASL